MQVKHSPLHADLVELVRVARSAERDLFAMLADGARDAPASIGEWSAKDIQSHIAAWRAIEARRLEAFAGVTGANLDDPQTTDPVDDSNARLHAEGAGLAWDEVERRADASAESLITAIGHSQSEALCECDGTMAGIGANGANHAMAHLSDVARLAGDRERYEAFVHQIESILRRGHLPRRDSGVMLYNIGCHHALAGDLDEARRLLRTAFAHRHDLLDPAQQDPDLALLSAELPTLAAAG